MSDIATLAGIAKGTLYNHFRTKEAVFAATVDAGIGALADECTAAAVDSLADGLALAADRLGSHPALRRISADEPAVLAALTSIGDSPTWIAAREGVRSVLAAGGRDASDASVEVALRWLVSFIGAPGSAIDRQASLVAAGLPAAPPPVTTAASSQAADDLAPQTFDDGSVQLSL